MKYTTLGSTDIKVSRICVGGMSFGRPSKDFHLWTLEADATQQMIAHAWEQGVNFIDTANCYSAGTSEEYIGRAIRNLGIAREDLVLASKVYFNEGKLGKGAIKREIEKTLRHLQTDYLDLYQIHRYDSTTPPEETMEALHELVKEGKVRAIGASAMYGFQFHNMQIIAEQNNLTKFSTMQNHYNLLYREDERELIPVCRQYNVSLIPYSPLAGGHLTRSTWDSASKRSETDKVLQGKYNPDMENNLQIIKRVDELAKKYEVSMSKIALAWHFAKGVASPIVGATKRHHFDDAIKAVDLELTKEDVQYLEEVYQAHRVMGALPVV